MDIKQININEIIPYENNPRHNDNAVDAVAKSIQEFGFKVPIIIDKNNVIVAGHTRLKAAQKLGLTDVPVIVADDLTDEQIKAFRLADNKVGELAEWDFEKLEQELAGLTIDMSDFGFELDTPEIAEERVAEEDDFDVDEALEQIEEPTVKRGEVWKLGNHYLMCGDATSKEYVETLLNGVKADLVFTDPPYGMKKESEGVLNDNLNYDDLLEFNKKWIPLTFEALKDNGSWYCWGIDEPLMDIYSHILKPMQKENKITFRNLITWDKGDAGAGGVSFMGKEGLRSYPISDEKCLFVMCGVQGFNNNTENYDETFEPIRSYLEYEAKKVGLTSKKLKEICGVGMYSHWFTKAQYGIIPKEHYEKLQRFYENKAFSLDYNDLRLLFDDKQHRTLHEAIMSKRAFFDNTHDKMKTVWEFGRCKGVEREQAGGHATPKPIALCSRAIKSSSREGESVLDLFGGSGSTLIACEQLNRNCYMMELDPKYCDVIIRRWETISGKKAERI